MDEPLELLFEGHPDGWWIVELDGDQLTAIRTNRVQARRFGMTAEQLQQVDLRRLVPASHYEAWLETVRNVVHTGAARSFDLEGPPLVGGLVRATIVPVGCGARGKPRVAVQIRDETARLLAQQALERSEARLAQAQEIGKVGDWELDLSTGTGTWSRQMYLIAGWRGDAPPSLEQFEALVHPEDRKTLSQFMAEVVVARDAMSVMFRLVTSSGETRRIAATALCIRDGLGAPMRLTGVSRDITAIEDAIESARRHEAELEVMFNDHSDGVYFTRLDEPIEWHDAADKDKLVDWVLDHGRPVRVNQAMCAILGAPAEAILGKPLRTFFPDRAEGRRTFRKLYDAGRVHLSRVQRVRADGSRWLAELDLVATRDEQGRITGQFGMMRDVTAQEAAAEALRQSEARLSLALESAELFPWTLDVPTWRTEVDPRWAARLGYTPEEMAERDAGRRMVHPADYPHVRHAFIEHFCERTSSVSTVYRHATRSGIWRWVEVHCKVTSRDPGGQPLRVTGIYRDVTEQRALEQRLSAAERMASLGTLAAGVGHEINNPLTYLSANLALMDDALAAEGDGDARPRRSVEELRRMLADARDGVLRIVRIVKDLRSLTRNDGQGNESVDVVTALDRSLELADHEIRHRAGVVRDVGVVSPVTANQGRLVQLFLNLLVNAAQAISEGSMESNQIRVSTQKSSRDQVVVEVTDTGCGMSSDIVARIFDPFFTTKKVGEGTGLGLPICHSIVTDLGGSLEVESVPGEGSTFRVRLPACGVTRVSGSASLSNALSSTSTLKVLVIDDEPTVGRLLARILQGHDVSVETRAESALARLRAGEHFDRILCDVMMPEMSGMDFHEALVRLDGAAAQKIIFMTGGAFSARAAAFLASVSNRTIEKPFEPDGLRAAVLQGTT